MIDQKFVGPGPGKGEVVHTKLIIIAGLMAVIVAGGAAGTESTGIDGDYIGKADGWRFNISPYALLASQSTDVGGQATEAEFRRSQLHDQLRLPAGRERYVRTLEPELRRHLRGPGRQYRAIRGRGRPGHQAIHGGSPPRLRDGQQGRLRKRVERGPRLGDGRERGRQVLGERLDPGLPDPVGETGRW